MQILAEGIFEFDESFIKHFLEVDIQYLETLHNLDNDLSFLSERMIIGKVGNL